MHSTRARTGQRTTRSKATFAATQKSRADPAEDTPTVRQRLAEARKTGLLDLRGVGIAQLPVDAIKLNLTALLLGNNKFTTIPSNLPSQYPHLAYLDFSQNRIQSIPNSLSDLQDLEVLDLEGNTELPDQLPTSFHPLIDSGKLAVLMGGGGDAGMLEETASEISDEEQDYGDVASAREKAEFYTSDDEDVPQDSDEDNPRGRYSAFLEAPATADNRSDRSNRSERSNRSVSSNIDTENLRTEARLFFSRIAALDNHRIESTFKKRWNAGDSTFVKYIARRYGQEAGKAVVKPSGRSASPLVVGRETLRGRREDESGAEDTDGTDDVGSADEAPIAGMRFRKKQIGLMRKVKERALKHEVQGGRKVKESLRGDAEEE
ncbi:hypothetical protein HK104_009204 [Borealophlyctis nickersoniae]|nr:hypothetical protein HK104_009204 [Borealophlyctis nickersoniae]